MNAFGDALPSVSFLGIRFDQGDEQEVVDTILALRHRPTFGYVVTPNVDHVVRLHARRGDAQLWASYEAAALSLCDSRILLGLARVAGLRLSLVTGSDLTLKLLQQSGALDRIAVVGGDDQLIKDLTRLFPASEWYHHAPPYGVLYNSRAQLEIIDFVESSPAEITFFAIGSPQSELICAIIAKRAKARGVALCMGASLEFVTGRKPRAPRMLQVAGLEWLFRLSSEPRRLWRRYLVEGPKIFLIWARWLVSGLR
jgi:exopolysaccharide biosynthesis WecB/TagA/CpsF family protein